MHILLTDVLACPRCGPAFGLILVPDEVHERRVASGILACANCRERYRIDDGIADLRAVTRPPGDEGAHYHADPHDGRALRLAALMGVSEGPAIVLIAGPDAARAGEIAATVAELEVIAAGGVGEVRSGAGVSAVLVGDALPVVSGKLRAVALTGDAADRFLEEGARAVAPTSRLVLDPGPADAEARLAAAGLRTLAHEGGTIIAARLR